MTAKKVTGIGGIFFKCENPEEIKKWYAENLGLVTNEYGSVFEFRSSDEPERKGYLNWSPFKKDTTYFQPSDHAFMINYRVENLETLLEDLRAKGVRIIGELESYSYGKFAHIMDPEGHKIELWEPVDRIFTDLYKGKTTR